MLPDVIQALRERVPILAGRVGGAAEVDTDAIKLPVPSAWVIPLDEKAGENQNQAGYQQEVEEGFAVLVVLDNTGDEKGLGAVTQLPGIRAALFAALLGWSPPKAGNIEYDAIEYSGGQLVDLNRSRLFYQFEFASRYYLDNGDTWYAARDAALPSLDTVAIAVDFAPPDGLIEHHLTVNLPSS
ncbi:phage tail terminator protein [Chitinibacteraceae bacterium HSL-7]